MSNDIIFEKGNPVTARKKELLSVFLGEVGKMPELEGISEIVDGQMHIISKEGSVAYDPSWIVQLRLFDYGKDGKKDLRLLNSKGEYDVFPVKPEKAAKMQAKTLAAYEGKSFDEKFSDLTADVDADTKEFIACLLELTDSEEICITPEEERTVIVITEDMIDTETGSVTVDLSYGGTFDAHPGDVFCIEANQEIKEGELPKGYIIQKEEFEETHHPLELEAEEEDEEEDDLE